MRPRWVSLIFLGGAVALSWPDTAPAAEEPPKVDSWDCGTVSLYHLLCLTGRSVDLSRLRSALGTAGAEGHSFRQLREAAGHFGLPVDAIVIPKQRSAIQGPVLLFAKLGRDGHFYVVRPVGHTGHLVQVLDGDRPPAVIDAERLFNSPAWTGLALVPHRPNYLAISAICVAFACMVAIGFRVKARWRRPLLPPIPAIPSGIPTMP
jgi:hypothetical protein